MDNGGIHDDDDNDEAVDAGRVMVRTTILCCEEAVEEDAMAVANK